MKRSQGSSLLSHWFIVNLLLAESESEKSSF
jgi:hypothetical protein